jgi:hypothetical protein
MVVVRGGRVFTTEDAEGIQRGEHGAPHWKVGPRDVGVLPVAGARIELDRGILVTLSTATPLHAAHAWDDDTHLMSF